MAGYNGFSMSNNAVAAYENGEKPLSKWTKKEILNQISNQIEQGELELHCSLALLKKLSLKALKENCLWYSSWHHTSNYFNETKFYDLDVDRIEELTDEKINAILSEEKAAKKAGKKTEEQEERWLCSFLEWSGTKKYPKAKEFTEEGTIKGNWFIRKNGTKKKTTANGFKKIKKLEE